MSGSKLEMYISIVSSLLKYGPLSLDEIVTFTYIDPKWLKEHINFLVAQGLARMEKNYNAIDTYAITETGVRITKFFNLKPLTQPQ